MKKLLFTLFSISILFAFSACGSDDEKEEKFFTGDCNLTTALVSGAPESTVTIPNQSTLDNLLKDSPGYGSPVSSGELLVNGKNTSVKITGLPVGTALKDFTIDVNGLTKNFGELSNEKVNLDLYTSANSKFFQDAFDRMVSNKNLDMKVTFTPTVQTTSEVKLEIIFSGRFSYWVKI